VLRARWVARGRADAIKRYFANPDAKYFGVAKINQAQLEDYAKRKGVSIEQAERLLSPNLE
jgi:5-methyltetrahydrofolate--homocysteine methyltransferase